MNDKAIMFLFVCMIVMLIGITLYQRFSFKKGIEKEIKEINQALKCILDTGCDEKVMVFTDNKVVMELEAQINSLLLDRQKVKVDFKREEISSKKMLSNISHDIKTPLTVILGYLEIMRLEYIDDGMLKKVEAKAKQVMELINQFFTLAKLEAGDMPVELSKLGINEVCKESILSFYDILIQRDFIVDIGIPEKTIFVWGDKDVIERIMLNLISNAIRYGSDGKYIGIFLRNDDKCAYIDVVDHGKGIERQFAVNVFERLYTMEDSRNREIQGNGLGLTIAKNLAIALEGDIILESQPNVKTVFTIKLKKLLY